MDTWLTRLGTALLIAEAGIAYLDSPSALVLFSGGRKPYEWVATSTGRKRRMRVYPIPPATPTEKAFGPNVLRIRHAR
ncbi:MAG: hypothetical protein AB7U75_01955 [Hyphomicrobiaceae bacterium]